MSAITCRGSGAANCCTKSHSPISAASTISWRARTRTLCSTWATVFGVKPFCTSWRNLACRGSSITIIEPKNSSVSGAWSFRVMPLAELNSHGRRLTERTSS